MKSISITVFLFLCLISLFSQNLHVIDSLKAESSKYDSDTNKINIYNQLSWAFGKKLDTALLYSDSALALSNKLNYRNKIQETHFKKGLLYYNHAMYNKALSNFFISMRISEELKLNDNQSQSAFQIANVYKDQGTYDKALSFYNQSLVLDKKYNNISGEASCLNNIGLVYWMQDSYEVALDYFLKSMEIKERIGDKRGIAGGYVNIGVIYYSQKNYAKAIEYWEKSQPIWEELNDNRGLVEVFNNIGAVYSEQKEHDKALIYLNKSLKIKEQLGDKKAISMTYSNIGEVFMQKKEPKKALEYFAQAIKINEEIKDFDGLASAHLSIAGYFKEMKDFKNALEYAEKGLEISKKIGALSKLKSGYLLVSEIYEMKGDNANSLANYKLFYEISDSIYQKNSSVQLAEIQTKYETVNKEKEIELLNKDKVLQDNELVKQQILTNAFIICSLFILIIAFVILNRYKLKKKTNDELTYQNLVIEQQKEELMVQKDLLINTNSELTKKNSLITDSINYAKKIQDALLPSENYIKNYIKDFFIFLSPKAIVSGDFYWFYAIDCNNLFIAVADCTGHGVPGAFMSMIGNTLLNEIIVENKEYDTSKILGKLNSRILHVISQNDGKELSHIDGMDISIIKIDALNSIMYVAGANQSAYIVSDNQLITIDGDLQSIGGGLGYNVDAKFTTQKLNYRKDSTYIYLLSDGFQDQFGGTDNKKFMVSNLQKLILKCTSLDSFIEQKTYFANTFNNWKGNNKQIDDVLIVGLKV
ncbi:MAG: hypothetical protein A2046_14010 [Bacteroidetes bacterium GWA2_30_7]|nr:MAG: hypothetical protein A2046_14010 [Bacteroidetes bacterium GWA2_30_7]